MAQDFISALFGSAPDYSGAFTPEQTQTMKQNALAQGGIGALIALLGASGEQPRNISTGQALAGALGAGYGGYQSSFDNTLKQMLTNQQLTEYKKKQDARAKYDQAIAGATTQMPQAIPMAQSQGSQLEMLNRPEFGGDMATTETIGALRGNLPMVDQVDPTVANSAALNYLREIDPAKFIELTTKSEKITGNVGQYQDAIKTGLIPQTTSFPQFLKLINEGKGTSVTVNAGDKELDKLDAKAIAALSDQVNSSRKAANVASSIATLLEGKGEGQAVQIGADLAQALGIQNETTDANSLAKALQVSAATQVRAAGSGSTSDLEFKSFLSVFPSLGNTESGRALMAKGLKAFADRDALIEKKARELQKQGNYSAAALAEYDATLGNVLDPKVFGSIKSTTRKSYN